MDEKQCHPGTGRKTLMHKKSRAFADPVQPPVGPTRQEKRKQRFFHRPNGIGDCGLCFSARCVRNYMLDYGDTFCAIFLTTTARQRYGDYRVGNRHCCFVPVLSLYHCRRSFASIASCIRLNLNEAARMLFISTALVNILAAE
jgi:hypothetical protein